MIAEGQRLFSQGNLEEALQRYKKALDELAGSLESEEVKALRPEIHRALGDIYEKLEKPGIAAAHLESAIAILEERDRCTIEDYIRLALLFEKIEYYSKARAAISKADRLDSSNPLVREIFPRIFPVSKIVVNDAQLEYQNERAGILYHSSTDHIALTSDGVESPLPLRPEPVTLSFAPVPEMHTLQVTSVESHSEIAPACEPKGMPQMDIPSDDGAREWKSGDIIMGLYEVKNLLGSGAFGKVYRVHHIPWNLDLAVKTLLSELADSEEHIQAFIAECQGWVSLGLHPNIVTCHYVRMIAGLPRIFSEYVSGGTLEEWIEKGSCDDIAAILDIAIQCLDGLSFAHQRGIIHQDIKPGNCLLTPEGEVRITDFGIASGLAKIIPNSTDMSLSAVETTMAVEGGAVGTPAYMPPEQWDRNYGEIGPWSDIYAFGVMLFEMCTGERPFDEGSESSSVLKARHLMADPPSPHETGSTIPETLSRFIRKCLMKKPHERFTCCDDARSSLTEIYHTITGGQYTRKNPKEIDIRADALNNRAISMLDLGLEEEAEKLWLHALQIDTHHQEATFNRSLVRWRNGEIADDDVLTLLEESRKTNRFEWFAHYLPALFHLERRDCRSALTAYDRIWSVDKERPEIKSLGETIQTLLSKSSQSLSTLEGHTAPVRAVEISHSSTLAATGSEDKTIRLWDIPSGKLSKVIEGHGGQVLSLCFSSDDQFILSGSADDTIRLWETATGRCRRIFEQQGWISALGLSADLRYAVSAGSGSFSDNTIRLWDIEKGTCLRYMHLGSSGTTALSLSSNGRYVLTGGADGTLQLVDIMDGYVVRDLGKQKGAVHSVRMDIGRGLAVVGHQHGSLSLWNLREGRQILRFIGHKSVLRDAALSSNGSLAVSGGRDSAVRLWELSTGRCLRTFIHAEDVYSVSFSRDGRFVLSGSDDNTARLWDISAFTSGMPWAPPPPYMLCRVANTKDVFEAENSFKRLTAESREALAAGNYHSAVESGAMARQCRGYERAGESLQLWRTLAHFSIRKSLKSGMCRLVLKGHEGFVNKVRLSSDGKTLLSGDDNSQGLHILKKWDVETGACTSTERGGIPLWNSPKGIWSIVRSEGDLNTLALVEGSLFMQPLRIFKGHTWSVTCAVLSPDGRWILSGSGDKTLRLWDIASGKCLRVMSGHAGGVTSIAFSPDGACCISGSDDKTVRLWEVATGKCFMTIEGHQGTVNVVAFYPSYPRSFAAISGSFDKTVRIWNLYTGSNAGILEGHTESVTDAALTPDGRYLVSASWDKTLRLWDLSQKIFRCLHVFEGHTGWVTSLSLSADGCLMASGSWDRTVRLWDLDWDLESGSGLWNEEARPWLQNFVTVHTPYEKVVPVDKSNGMDSNFIQFVNAHCAVPLPVTLADNISLNEEDILKALTRKGKPLWNDQHFRHLLYSLRCAGYGSIKPELVKENLEKIVSQL